MQFFFDSVFPVVFGVMFLLFNGRISAIAADQQEQVFRSLGLRVNLHTPWNTLVFRSVFYLVGAVLIGIGVYNVAAS